jgi:hypothetical protein
VEGYQIANVLEMLITAGSVLAGLWIVTRVWIHRRSRLTGSDLSALTGSIDSLRNSVEDMRQDLAERALSKLGGPAGDRQLPPS